MAQTLLSVTFPRPEALVLTADPRVPGSYGE